MVNSELERQTWEFTKDTILLGLLYPYKTDWPWIFCRFNSTPNFSQYEHLFSQELRLLNEYGGTDEWEEAYKLISDQVFTLKLKEEIIRKFILHIEGTEAWFTIIQ